MQRTRRPPRPRPRRRAMPGREFLWSPARPRARAWLRNLLKVHATRQYRFKHADLPFAREESLLQTLSRVPAVTAIHHGLVRRLRVLVSTTMHDGRRAIAVCTAQRKRALDTAAPEVTPDATRVLSTSGCLEIMDTSSPIAFSTARPSTDNGELFIFAASNTLFSDSML